MRSIWRDSRVAQLPAGVDRSPWAIPLVVDGRASFLRGELTRYPAPGVIGWGLLLAGVLAFGAWLVFLRRLEVTRAAALACAALGGAVCPVLALGFALDADSSPGTWIEGFNEIVFVAVGVALLVRGRGGLRAGAAVGLGLVSLAVGLLDSPVFVHPVVLSLLPGSAHPPARGACRRGRRGDARTGWPGLCRSPAGQPRGRGRRARPGPRLTYHQLR